MVKADRHSGVTQFSGQMEDILTEVTMILKGLQKILKERTPGTADEQYRLVLEMAEKDEEEIHKAAEEALNAMIDKIFDKMKKDDKTDSILADILNALKPRGVEDDE